MPLWGILGLPALGPALSEKEKWRLIARFGATEDWAREMRRVWIKKKNKNKNQGGVLNGVIAG